MPKKIGNTVVPRNPIAKSPLMKRGGAHTPKRSTQRSGSREALQSELEDWRDDLEDLRRSQTRQEQAKNQQVQKKQSKENDET